jgi:hypothetical protein
MATHASYTLQMENNTLVDKDGSTYIIYLILSANHTIAEMAVYDVRSQGA